VCGNNVRGLSAVVVKTALSPPGLEFGSIRNSGFQEKRRRQNNFGTQTEGYA
jgi:hypothetical protein